MEQELLQRYIAGEATETEKQQVTEWLHADEQNLREFMVLRKLYDISLWQEPAEKVLLSSEKSEEKPVRKLWIQEVLKVAAIVAVVLAGAYFWQESKQPQWADALQTIHVPAGQRAELFLADGTKVWLNAETTLTFPAGFTADTRQVKLDGEGYFQVAQDASKPFIVETSKYNVRVLGTEFNVIAYASDPDFETALIEGSVEVFSPLVSGSVILEPHTQVKLVDGKLQKTAIRELDYFLWREGIISFQNASVAHMFEDLERFYGVKIIVNNKDILKNHYTGKFRSKDGIEHVLKVLQLNNKFTYKKDNEKNAIAID